MFSKESDYLIHLAEKQLERLNNSLYFYQRNAEIQEDLLDCSVDRLSDNQNSLSLTPIYDIIQRQRQADYSRGTPYSFLDVSPPRRPTKKVVANPSHKYPQSAKDNHIRAWRHGPKVVQQALGPTTHLSYKSHSILTPPSVSTKKEKLSTFWDCNGHRRTGKASKPMDNINKPAKLTGKCCSPKDEFKRNEIRKYIRDKQKSYNEKQFESNLKTKLRKEQMNTSLNNLNKDRYTEFKRIDADERDLCHKLDKKHPTQNCSSIRRKSSMNKPIYDELSRDGVFDSNVHKKADYILNQAPLSRIKNGFNSTVDSGFETGEWLQTVTRETKKIWNDTGCNQVSEFPQNEIKESVRKQDVKRKSNSLKYQSGYHNEITKQYNDTISAYDAGSENEMGQDMMSIQQNSTPPPSPYSSNHNESESPNNYLNSRKCERNESQNDIRPTERIEKNHALDRMLSVSMPNCNADFSCESTSKKSDDGFGNSASFQTYLIDELKQALLDAQITLNPDKFEPNSTMSERISKAVHNFVQKIGQRSGSVEAFDSGNQLQSCKQLGIVDNSKSSHEQIAFSRDKNEKRRELLSTEYEATDIEYENCKQVSKVAESDPLSFIQQEIREISEEKLFSSMESDKSEIIDDVMKERITATLSTRKRDLQSRRDKANELIKLTQEFKKESKRVKLLEKKACQFSKQYLQDPMVKRKKIESVECSKQNITNIGIAKLPRHTIPPDGKDSGRSEVIGNTEQQLLPEMKEITLKKERGNDENCPTDVSTQSNSGMFDVDEPTVSISEVSTTLSDKSELEARLVALRAEMSKKQQLVVKLKSHQKEMKRDKIKQNEIILQKQLDMYDAYILDLKTNIEQLDNKVEEAESDDSHTLMGSMNNINDLEPVTLAANEVVPAISPHEAHYSEMAETCIDDIFETCCQEYPNINEVSINTIVENNVVIAGEYLDLDSMLGTARVNDTAPKDSDMSAMVTTTSLLDMEVGCTVVGEVCDKGGLPNEQFEEMAIKNESQEAITTDLDLEEMYFKESVVLSGDEINDNLVLEELLSKNLSASVTDDLIQFHVIVQDTPIIEVAYAKSDHQSEVDGVEKREEPDVKISVSREFESSHVFDSSSYKESDFVCDAEINHPITSHSDNDNVDENVEDNLKCLNYCSDDDRSSISDMKSNKFAEECSPDNIKTAVQDVCATEDLSPDVFDIYSPLEKIEPFISSADSSGISSEKVEQLVDCLLASIMTNEIEFIKYQTAQKGAEDRNLLSAAETADFQSTSFMEPNITLLPTVNKEEVQYSVVPRPEDTWEFSDVTVEAPSVNLDSLLPTGNNTDKEAKLVSRCAESISEVDKQILSDKMKWLIPFEAEKLELHITSAISHLFQSRQIRQGDDSSTTASEDLPAVYMESMSSIADFDDGVALFDSLKQKSYIDKRIIFQLVREIFLEIYSVERYQPQMPWIHSSFMVKRKNYTTWKGHKPPQSYDLVSKIVRERLCQLFNQKNIFLEGATAKNTETSSHSKITKWCIERQKDQVDKLLINDLRKEENEWVYYDDEEEEVKIQIAEDIMQHLIIDTASWMRSDLSLD